MQSFDLAMGPRIELTPDPHREDVHHESREGGLGDERHRLPPKNQGNRHAKQEVSRRFGAVYNNLCARQHVLQASPPFHHPM